MKENEFINQIIRKLNYTGDYQKFIEEMRNLSINALEPKLTIQKDKETLKFSSLIDEVYNLNKNRYCTEKDNSLTIDEKKQILNNTLELLKEDINKNFNDKINIFPKVDNYTNKVKKAYKNLREKINVSIYNQESQDNLINYEEKIITLLKKLDRNHIFQYENKKFYPFIYDILNTYSFISFKIEEYRNLIKTINSLKDYGNFEPTNNELKDIMQISKIFKINQLHNLIYILFNEFDSDKDYKSLMKIIFYCNDNQKKVFENKQINNYLNKLNITSENTITAYKHFFYS